MERPTIFYWENQLFLWAIFNSFLLTFTGPAIFLTARIFIFPGFGCFQMVQMDSVGPTGATGE